MSRVLVTGGAGPIGSAVVRRLLRDPDWEVRVADHRPAPDWMREGCEIAVGDLGDPVEAAAALTGCSHVIHLGATDSGAPKPPHTLTQFNNALTGSILQVAIDQEIERFVYVSSSMVFERATQFPTTEEHIHECPAPRSACGFSQLAGEVYVRAAHEEYGLRYTICRPFDAYGQDELPEPIDKALAGQAPLQIVGTGQQTRTLTHVDDVAEGIVIAMASPAGENEDFNISASEELTVAEIARLIWEVCGYQPEAFALERLPPVDVDVQRRWPSVEKARRLLGWEAKVDLRHGIASLEYAPPLSAER